MTRQNRKELTKETTEYISVDDKRKQENMFHHRCSGCNKTIGKKAFDIKALCNSCYTTDNRENVRRNQLKTKTKKRAKQRRYKTTFTMYF